MIITQGLLVVNYTNVPIKWVAKGLEYILSLHLFISLKFLLHTCYKISSNDSKEQAPYNYSRSPFFPSRYELAGIYIQSLPPPKGGDLLSWQPLEELSNWLTDWLGKTKQCFVYSRERFDINPLLVVQYHNTFKLWSRYIF